MQKLYKAVLFLYNMKKRVMITSIFSARAIKLAITKLSPDKVICVVERGYDKLTGEDSEKKRKAIDELKSGFGDILTIEILETEWLYNLYEITKDVINKIDELSKDYDIYIHISEGRKTLAFGLSFASYMRRKNIKGIYYVKTEDNELMKLPLFNFPVNISQKEILKYIGEGYDNIEILITKTGKSRSIVYQYVKELLEDGYITNEEEKLGLADLGRIMIL